MATTNKANKKTLVVGAGMAGLSACAHLQEAGFHQVLILEATDRIGGRIYTTKFGHDRENIVELGANWIHGAALTNSVFTLANQANLCSPFILLNRTEGYFYTHDGRVINNELSDNVWQIFQAIEAEIDTLSTSQYSTSNNIMEYMKTRFASEVTRFPLESREDALAVFNAALNFLGFHNGDDMTKFPLGSGDSYDVIPGGDVKIPKGVSAIPKILHRSLKEGSIQFNKAVSCIKWDGLGTNLVSVSCIDGSVYLTDHVIITVSLGFLKTHLGTLFDPILPKDKIKAIQNIGFGSVNKIFLLFEKPFWKVGNGGIKLAWYDNSFELNNSSEWYKRVFAFDEVLNNPCMLVAWVSGDSAKEVEQLSQKEVGETCTEIIRIFLKNPSIPFPERIICTKWNQDQYACGSYSYVAKTTSADDMDNLARPMMQNCVPVLLFAGEATHSRWYSTMHAARSSGLREADRIIKTYGKESRL